MKKFLYSKIARGTGMVMHYVLAACALLMVFAVCYYCMRSNGIRYENLDTFEESQAYADVLDSRCGSYFSILRLRQKQLIQQCLARSKTIA